MRIEPHVRTFECGGIHIAVTSESPEDLSWIAEFFVESSDVPEPTCRIDLRVDPDHYRSLLAECRALSLHQVDCLTCDGHTERLPAHQGKSGAFVVLDEGRSAIYRVRNDPPSTMVLTANRSPKTKKIALKILREYAINHLHTDGALVLHAAILRFRGRGIGLVGPKGAGKTTLLVHLLREPHTAFISNDRASIRLGEATPIVSSLPTIVSVAPGTVARFTHLRQRLALPPYLRPVEAPPRSLSLTSLQLVELLEAPRTATASLNRLVFPRFDPQVQGISLARLSQQQATRRFREQVLLPPAGCDRFSIFTAEGGVHTASLGGEEPLCLEIGSRVACFECRIGRDAYATSSPHSLLHDVTRDAA